MVEIKCLACGKGVNVPRFIDVDKFEGQIVCQKCKSLLYVKLVNKKVQKYRIFEDKSKFDFTELVLKMQEERNQQGKSSLD